MTKPISKLPAFNSIEEEADFWDTYDTTDFEAEFKPIEVSFALIIALDY